MNQSNAVRRTSISFALAIVISLIAISIQNNTGSDNKVKLEAKVYPERNELMQK